MRDDHYDDYFDGWPTESIVAACILGVIRILLWLAFWIVTISVLWWMAGGSLLWFIPLFGFFCVVWFSFKYIVRSLWAYLKSKGWRVA